MMKNFNELTVTDLINISDADLSDAITRQAIAEGIAIPIPNASLFKECNYQGYQYPKDTQVVYGIMEVGAYRNKPDLCYLTREEAVRAMNGLVKVSPMHDSKYKEIGNTINTDKELTITEIHIGMNSSRSIGSSLSSKLKNLGEDTKAFDEFVQKCMEWVSEMIYQHRSKQFDIATRDEYIRLANGNIQTAKSFWNKLQPNTAWPEDGLTQVTNLTLETSE